MQLVAFSFWDNMQLVAGHPRSIGTYTMQACQDLEIFYAPSMGRFFPSFPALASDVTGHRFLRPAGRPSEKTATCDPSGTFSGTFAWFASVNPSMRLPDWLCKFRTYCTVRTHACALLQSSGVYVQYGPCTHVKRHRRMQRDDRGTGQFTLQKVDDFSMNDQRFLVVGSLFSAYKSSSLALPLACIIHPLFAN